MTELVLAEAHPSYDPQAYDREFVLWGAYGDELLGVRPLVFDLAKLRDLWALHTRHETFFSDHVMKSFENFSRFFINYAKLAMEMVELPSEKHVGILYLTDLLWSETSNEVVEAYGHFSFWDGKIGARKDLVRELMRLAAKALKIHRITVRIPCYAPGAILAASKVGFSGSYMYSLPIKKQTKNVLVEGVLRKAIEFRGKWEDVVLLSMVGDELT